MAVKVQGERWFPSELTFSDEMVQLWGDWYCDSEVGTLRAVLLHRQTVIIGTGSRTNEGGANQVESVLRNIGVTNIIQDPNPLWQYPP